MSIYARLSTNTAATLPGVYLHHANPMATRLKKYAWHTLLSAALLFAGTAHAAAPHTTSPPLAITVSFDFYPEDSTRIHQLEQKLKRALQRARVGELGETEFHLDGNEGFFYLLGPDPERLFAVVGPILQSSPLMKNAEVEERTAHRKKTFVIQPDAAR